MMKGILAKAAVLAPVLMLAAPAVARELPVGLWARGDGNAKVRIAPCGDALCATNTFIRDTSGGEAVGDKLVMRVKSAGERKLTGSAFDPKRDSTYAITITFDDARMKTRGCLLAVLCKSVSWQKID
jgi:uncharacterized protein (DUF2147 family)